MYLFIIVLYELEFIIIFLRNSFVLISSLFIIGRFRYDVLTRLEFANIDKEKLVLIDDLDTVIKKVKKESLGDIYTMVCFDMTAILLKLIKEENHENI